MKNNIKKYIIYNFALFFLIQFLNSCLPQGVDLEKKECLEIPQNCYPNKWSGTPLYDTSKSSYEQNGFYYRMEKVEGINSPDDEWQLSFINDNKAILTYSETDLNNSLIVLKANEKRFIIDKGVSSTTDGHIGTFSINNDNVFFASSTILSVDTIHKYQNYTLTDINNVIGKSRIFSGKISNDEITNIEEIKLDDIEVLDWVSHSAISPNSKILVFSSDKKNGFGGTDLWLIFKNSKNEWSKAINLGNNVNSKCDEITPFFSKDGKRLYFSSSGHHTVGAYDIFYCDINPKLYSDYLHFSENDDISDYFSIPKNLGPPINTEYDELFPTTFSDANDILYYASNQNKNMKSLVATEGGFDLFVCYKVKKSKFEDTSKKKTLAKNDLELDIKDNYKIKLPNEEILIKGKVLSKTTNINIDSAQILIKNLDNISLDSTIYTDKFAQYQFPITRNTQYELTAQKSNYFYDSKRIFISNDFVQDTMDIDFYLPEIGEIRINFPTDKYKDPYKYALDSNGIETGRLWTDELKLVAENIKLSIDKIDSILLVGHTDDVGTDEYNLGLGQRRVDFVANELVKLGISKELLVTRSAGENQPLIRYENEELSKYRKRLRRVSMKKYFK